MTFICVRCKKETRNICGTMKFPMCDECYKKYAKTEKKYDLMVATDLRPF
jgi:hypothetical protein